ncbi:uncharacterized protein [Ambystoma mexicanum]|uniref:uncharacterized protein isoform X1 n=1 Tax=Ambystoma mexicanum TaxID=8296 RepID=UPI0037E71C3D
MGRLCEKCWRVVQELLSQVRELCSGLGHRVREILKRLCECCCLWQGAPSRKGGLYGPVLQQHEKRAARDFLRHLESDFEESPLGNESLEALRTLSFSELPDLQQSAALYYLHISQHLNTQLPEDYLEPYHALLQSNDLEVQRMSSLSLVNFLLEGNVKKEVVVESGLLEPMLELLESSDAAVQCNSCACIMTLASSESNQDTIGSAGAVVPLLALAKSYDPRVQQNAVGAILNLTRSERVQHVLCQEGALPVLTMLLQSSDSEVQYYSCSALSKIASNPRHHEAMLLIGDRFLLRMLLSLLSSSVDKVSCQACLCLRNLAESGNTTTDLIEMNVLPPLLVLLNSDNEDVQQASITLLCSLSQNPSNQEALLCEEVLERMGTLLQTQTTNTVIVSHAACIIENLSLSENIQEIIESPCFEGMLKALLCPENDETCLQYVASCIAELTKHDSTTSYLLTWMDTALITHLVRLAGQLEHTELAYQAGCIISHLALNEKLVPMFRFRTDEILCYLKHFLNHPEFHFQELGLATLSTLNQDAEFSSAISQSQMLEQMSRIREQTEETPKPPGDC